MPLLDVLIVGAGSAGLMCAARLCHYSKNAHNSIKIAIIDSNSKIGRKLTITGNGRCNITNSDIDCSLFNSDNAEFVNSVYSEFDSNMTMDFFTNELGLFLTKKNSLVYPYSLKSSSVIDSLRKYLCDNDVDFILDSKVIKITKEDCFTIYTDGMNYTANNVVIATGGSSYKITGSDGSGYRLLASFLSRKDFTPVRPSLIQLTSNDSDIKSLSGSRFNCKLSLIKDNSEISKEDGELLFTDTGISGICVMQLSRFLTNGRYYVNVDFLPEYSEEYLTKYIKDCFDRFQNRLIVDALSGILLPGLIEIVLKRNGISLSKSSGDSSSLISKIVKTLKCFRISISGTEDFDKAQVTSGGLNLCDLSSNLETRINGLYACGEVLNVDGPCGGYNLQWAWSSADAVARGVINKLYGF